MLIEDGEHRNVYIFGIVFVICFVIAAAVINYFTYSPEGEFAGWELILTLVFWSVQYLPIFVFHKYAKWEIKDFGFVTNYKVFLILVFAAIIVLPQISNLPKSTFKMHSLRHMQGLVKRSSLEDLYTNLLLSYLKIKRNPGFGLL